MMELNRFWTLIDAARTGARDEEHFLERIRSTFQPLTPDELLAFQRTFYRLSSQSYTSELWGAAYLINGGCSDDGFDYFRAWLIAQGRGVFEAALKNPDSLAGLADPEGELEEFAYVAQELYEERTGSEMPESVHEEMQYPELDEEWDFDDEDEMVSRYPKLFAKYG